LAFLRQAVDSFPAHGFRHPAAVYFRAPA
jgi:hypothetical protein